MNKQTKTSSSQADDLKTLALIKSGNKNAYEKLFKKYFGYVKRGYELKLNYDNMLAEDLAMELFEKVFLILDKYEPQYEFNTWLSKVASHHLIDYIRQIKAQKYICTVSVDILVGDEDNSSKFSDIIQEDFTGKRMNPEQELLSAEKKQLIMAAISRLDDRSKILINMLFFEGLTYNEMCNEAGLVMNTLKISLTRAKQRLAKLISPNLI